MRLTYLLSLEPRWQRAIALGASGEQYCYVQVSRGKLSCHVRAATCSVGFVRPTVMPGAIGKRCSMMGRQSVCGKQSCRCTGIFWPLGWRTSTTAATGCRWHQIKFPFFANARRSTRSNLCRSHVCSKYEVRNLPWFRCGCLLL